MRLLRLTSSYHDLPDSAVVCHDVRNPTQRNEILVRKGTLVGTDELRQLLARNVGELHLAVPDADDLTEDEAAAALGAAIAGSGVEVTSAHFGQVGLTSSSRGMLRVSRDTLERVNANDGVLLMTAEPDRAVDSGTTLGVLKCAPVLLPRNTVQAVAAAGEVMEVQPFVATRVAFLAPADRLRGGAFERARAALASSIEWFGSSLDSVIAADASAEGIASAFRQAAGAGAGLILSAGASATDPLDVGFHGLRLAGGEVDQIGIPAEPGTACWIGRLGAAPVLGLASCELFGRPGALDLILPRLFTGDTLDRDFVRGLAFGGLLMGPSRIAPFHTPETSVE